MYKSIYNGEIKEAHTYKKNNIITGREGAHTYKNNLITGREGAHTFSQYFLLEILINKFRFWFAKYSVSTW